MPLPQRATAQPGSAPTSADTIRQAATTLGLTPSGVWSAIRRGALAATWHHGRWIISPHALAAFHHHRRHDPAHLAQLRTLIGQALPLTLPGRPPATYPILAIYALTPELAADPALAEAAYCLLIDAAPATLIPLTDAVWEPVAALLWPDPRPRVPEARP